MYQKKLFNLMFGVPATAGIGIKIAQIYEMAGYKKGGIG